MYVGRFTLSCVAAAMAIAQAACVDLGTPWSSNVVGTDAGIGKDSALFQPDAVAKAADTAEVGDLPASTDMPVPDVAVTLQSALVLYYRCDETSGSTLSDASGNGHDADLSGSGSFVSGKVGGAVSLSGGGYATIPSGIFSGLTDVTVATWLLLSSTFPSTRVFEFSGDSSHHISLTSNNSSFSMSGPMAFSMAAGASNFDVVGPAPAIGSWIHVAVVLSHDSCQLYVNGQLATQVSTSVSMRDLGDTSSNLLGRSKSYDGAPFDGSIDEFRIYGRALTATEIRALAGR